VNGAWPRRGPWVLALTSADVDVRTAAAALAAAATVPVAAVVLGATIPADDPARPHLAGLLELPAADRLTLAQAGDLVRTMSRTHDLVLVTAATGLLVPLGRDGWTMTDLAAALRAPAVVVTGPGPDAINHTTLALGAMAAHGVPAAVVTIGDMDEQALPVTPAGRIPAPAPNEAGPSETDRSAATPNVAGLRETDPGAPTPNGAGLSETDPSAPTPNDADPSETDPSAPTPNDADPSETDPSAPTPNDASLSDADLRDADPSDAGADEIGSDPAEADGSAAPSPDVRGDRMVGAAAWFDPMLRATADPVDAAPGEGAVPGVAGAAPGRAAVSGKRLVLGLLAVFVVMVLVVCGLAWRGRGPNPVNYTAVTVAGVPPSAEASRPAWSAPVRTRTSTDVCPENAGRAGVTRPDAATTARVDQAWHRIEKWLAAHAPAGTAGLRPPASAARVDDLQRRMSVAFPADLVASLRRHDGISSPGAFALPPFFSPLTVDGILSDWRVNCYVMAGGGTEWADPWWDKAFVPFATTGGGGSLLVDQRPGGHGRVGEFGPEDGTDFAAWPASVTELLERTATSLETGRPYAGHYTPEVDATGHLNWKIG
jgi:cell wall assembly regulator SMI1